ncbi:MAG: hypothetical protein AAB403_12420, partial [Planctomycetota bacterium]
IVAVLDALALGVGLGGQRGVPPDRLTRSGRFRNCAPLPPRGAHGCHVAAVRRRGRRHHPVRPLPGAQVQPMVSAKWWKK